MSKASSAPGSRNCRPRRAGPTTSPLSARLLISRLTGREPHLVSKRTRLFAPSLRRSRASFLDGELFVGRHILESIDVTAGPADHDLVRAGGCAQAEVDTGIAGRHVAAVRE